MPKRCVSFALMGLLVVSSVVLCADTPWKDKAPVDWTADDIRQILDNSPWSQMALVSATWVLYAEHESKVVARAQMGRNKRDPEGNPSDPPDASTQAFGDKVIYWVLWSSSNTVQEALARVGGQAAPSLNPASARCASNPEFYLLILHGDDMRPFAKPTEAELQEKTWLRIGPGKALLRPENVQKEYSAQGGDLRQVLFFFPRHLPNGKPWNAAHEQQIEFRCEGWQAVVEVKFQPARMVNSAGRDL